MVHAKMSNPTTAPAGLARRGWASRLLRRLRPGSGREASVHPARSSTRVRETTRQLVSADRYVFVLRQEAMEDVTEAEAAAAWDALADRMALVTSGVVPVVHANGAVGPVEVGAFYLDRFAVTNRQYQRFVEAGGYDALEIWPQEVWPSLMKFTDQSRRPGPRGWQEGSFPAGLADHPVVGVCWYEAAAYAAWVGKRLPTAVEWQKAGGWPEQFSGGHCQRYPWGNVYEPARANLGGADGGRTVPVDHHPDGATPNGIYQLTGNVWEWLADPLDTIPCHADEVFVPWRPMRRIIGGAFDTFFPAEATCQAITGQAELDRRPNLGFRCAVPAVRLRPRPDR